MRFSTCLQRKKLSDKYAKGIGIEIGALSSAWPVPEGAHVRYLDRYSKTDLVKQYPEMDPAHFPETDFIDDGRVLNTIESESQDFLLHSHVLEHSDNPMQTLETWLHVLKVGGFCIGAVPNKDHTFDRDRPVTKFESLEDAYRGEPQFKLTALRTFHQHVDKLEGQALEAAIMNSLENDLHFHFPVWDFQAFRFFLAGCLAILKIKFVVEDLYENGGEMLFVIRRTA